MARFVRGNGRRRQSLASGSAHPPEVEHRRPTCDRGNLESAEHPAMLANQDRTIEGCRAIGLAVSASLESRKLHVSTSGNTSAARGSKA